MPEPLSSAQIGLRLAGIAAILATTAAAFGFDAGWFEPERLTQDKMIARLEQVGGVHPGFRRNHAKGVCATGTFKSEGAAVALSRAAVFKPGETPVVARFSLAGPMPLQADAPDKVRSLALRFKPAGAEEWRTGMINLPVFPVKTAQGFYESLTATAPDPATGKPDPEKLKAFVAANPEAGPATDLIKARKISSGFDDTTYNALNAFRFVDANGHKTPVRWSAVPVQPFKPVGAAPEGQKNYLFDDLVAKIEAHPLQWRLVLTVGEADDATDDPSVPWPAERKQVDAGLVTIDTVRSEDDGRCNAVNYDPTIVPDGIALSNDPILSARSAAYAKSFTLRAGETKPPSAITAETIAEDATKAAEPDAKQDAKP